jgi:hypothetical protein
VNVVEFVRFIAMLLISGALIRLVELHWGSATGVRGQIAQGLGVVY